jgi:hypothetical protein
MVFASSGVSADAWQFGTAETYLTTYSADATCPDIDNWEYSLDYFQVPLLDVQIICEFKDDSGQAVDFAFTYYLHIELWKKNPPEYIEFYDANSYSENDNSANWANLPNVHQQSLSVEIVWIPPQVNQMYKCTLTAYLKNFYPEPDVDDTESDSWFITCVD